MPRQYVLDEHGEPRLEPDLYTWAGWFERDERRVVREQRWTRDNGDEVMVSTVFLGLDHGWMGGPPVLWETMGFVNGESLEQDRYTSRTDAIAGHQRMVRAMDGPVIEDAEVL